MTAFRQLYDPHTSTAYAVDGKALVFRISSDDIRRETRLKPHFAAILLALFKHHPEPVSYAAIRSILHSHQLACPDETRLHRKVSELRIFLTALSPTLEGMIRNTRGIGYSLPLHFKTPGATSSGPQHKIANKVLQGAMQHFRDLIALSLQLSAKCPIVKYDDGYILKRQPVHKDIEKLLHEFEKQKKQLVDELRCHPADFALIRIEFALARLKTYLGLARISEFSITKEQWLDWHEQETSRLFDELLVLIKDAEKSR